MAVALAPTLVFTLVLAAILRDRFGIPDVLFGALLLYTALATMLPSLVLREPFDVSPLGTAFVNPEDLLKHDHLPPAPPVER